MTRVGLRSGVDLPDARYSAENIGNEGGRLGKALQVWETQSQEQFENCYRTSLRAVASLSKVFTFSELIEWFNFCL